MAWPVSLLQPGWPGEGGGGVIRGPGREGAGVGDRLGFVQLQGAATFVFCFFFCFVSISIKIFAPIKREQPATQTDVLDHHLAAAPLRL